MMYASKCILQSQKFVHVNNFSIAFVISKSGKKPFTSLPLIHCVYTIKTMEQVECFLALWKNAKMALSGTGSEQLWFLFINTMLPSAFLTFDLILKTYPTVYYTIVQKKYA